MPSNFRFLIFDLIKIEEFDCSFFIILECPKPKDLLVFLQIIMVHVSHHFMVEYFPQEFVDFIIY